MFFGFLPFLGKVVTYVGTVTGGRLDRMGRYEILVGARTPWLILSWEETPNSVGPVGGRKSML